MNSPTYGNEFTPVSAQNLKNFPAENFLVIHTVVPIP